MKKIFSLGGINIKEDKSIELPTISSTEQIRLRELERKKEFEELEAKKAENEKLIDLFKSCLLPFEDRVLIHPDKAPNKTDTGLYIPEQVQAQQAPARGTVINVGPGKPDRPMALKPRMRVLYGNFAGQLVQDPFNKVEYLIMRMADVFIEIQGNG